MGFGARARAHLDGSTHEGVLLLEGDALVFRSEDARATRIALSAIRHLEAVRGTLAVVHAGGRATFTIPAPERWVERIRTPRSRLDKLGIYAGTSVHLRGLDDPALRTELVERRAVLRTRLTSSVEVVLFHAPDGDSLVALDAIRHATSETVAIWVLWPRGSTAIREGDVREAARGRGLVDVKVARVSDALAGLKLVVRREQRQSGSAPVRRARPSARAKPCPATVVAMPVPVPAQASTPRAPADLVLALDGRSGAQTRWDALPPSHRRRYLAWIGEAKGADTRARRIAQTVVRVGGR